MISTILLLALIGTTFCLPENAVDGLLPLGIKVYRVTKGRADVIDDLLPVTLRPDVVKEHEKTAAIGNTRNTDTKKLDTVLVNLQSLKKEVQDLKEQISTLKKDEIKKDVIMEKCVTGNEKRMKYDFFSFYCGNTTKPQKNFYLIDANYGRWQKEGFCRVLYQRSVESLYYKVSVNMFNVEGPEGISSGFPGIAFNVQDQNNFDFIYLRLHRPSSCYRTGYIQKGTIRWSGSRSGVCPEGPPRGRTWFTFEVHVLDTEAVFSINNIKVKEFRTHYPSTGRAGVILAAGQKNKVRFRHFNITEIRPLPFSIHSCFSYSHLERGYFTLDGSHGEWPEDGFCRAISKTTIPDENYAVAVSLHNQRAYMGIKSGILGVIYNVQDYYNFDFVYIRPHSVGACFTTGFVQNSEILWLNSKVGSCSGGPPKGKWFNMTVRVRQSHVSITLDMKHLTSVQAHFPNTGRGGVIVGNGLSNVASFRDYRIYPIEPLSFDFVDCTSKSRDSQFYYILDASHGHWPKDTFCRAVFKKTVPGDNYVLSVKLFIQGRWRGADSNYAGLLFNAKDNNNYDFIYFKPNAESCFTTGYVLNGVLQWSGVKDGFCPSGPPKTGTWCQFEVSVRQNQVMVEVNGKHIVSYKAHFPVYGRGGVIVGNGRRNVLTFRDFFCYATKSLPFLIQSCGEGTRRTNGSFVLDASLDKSHGHCRALSRRSVERMSAASKYIVESKLYHVSSWRETAFGFMFNVVSDHDYDFVVLNLRSKQNCYQFGKVINGEITNSIFDFGSCNFGRPRRNAWLLLRIEVHRKGRVLISIDGRQTGTGSISHEWKARSGIIVRNGNRNVVMFREFHQQMV